MQRVLTPELMDDPSLDDRLHKSALAGLRRINAWSRTANYLRAELSRIAERRNLSSLSVLDVACGSGDMARSLATGRLANGAGLRVSGCDLSPVAIEQARRLTDAARTPDLDFFSHDALVDPFPRRYDVVMSTLFLHHLTAEQAVGLLRHMSAAAAVAVVVDDLVRSRLGHALAWAGCRLLTRSPVVHHDGPASVRAAFTPAEAIGLAADAGLAGARTRRHWPQRYLLTWEAE